MKLWTPPESAAFLAYDNDEEDLENVEVVHSSHILDPHHLDIEKFKEKYKDVIQDVPGKTQIVSMTYAEEMLCLYDCPRTGWPTTLKKY